MNLKTINREIEAKKKEISKLDSQLEEIQQQRGQVQSFIDGLERAIQLLPRDASQQKKPENILRSNSDPAKARTAILKAGKPLHVNEILGNWIKDVTKKDRVSLSSSLGAYARKEEIFTKVAPRVFGLIELGHNEEAYQEELVNEDEPPADFGLKSQNLNPIIQDDPFADE